MTERRVFLLQFAAACAYAAALAPLRPWYEAQHLTILTVIGGTLLALAPAAYLARRQSGAWWHYERWVWLGFVVSGAPIAVWQGGLVMGWWR
jgi:hypothetical protein